MFPANMSVLYHSQYEVATTVPSSVRYIKWSFTVEDFSLFFMGCKCIKGISAAQKNEGKKGESLLSLLIIEDRDSENK